MWLPSAGLACGVLVLPAEVLPGDLYCLAVFGGSLFVSHLAFLDSALTFSERLIARAQQLSAQLSSQPHLLLPAGSPGDPSFLRSLSLPPSGDASAGLNNFPSGTSPVSLGREDAGSQQ